jgi:hypothetical protein
MERIPAHPQLSHDGQIPGCAITLPTTLNTGLYQDYEWRKTGISDRVENIPLFPFITRVMIRNMQKEDKLVLLLKIIVM